MPAVDVATGEGARQGERNAPAAKEVGHRPSDYHSRVLRITSNHNGASIFMEFPSRLLNRHGLHLAEVGKKEAVVGAPSSYQRWPELGIVPPLDRQYGIARRQIGQRFGGNRVGP